ncbi:MAG: IS21 family transposase [Sinimarinibacterium sp.]
MAQPRLSVRKIREVLRLRFEAGVSERQIGVALSMARSTVQECLRRVREAGLSWPLPGDADDAALEARLYPVGHVAPTFPKPDFEHVHAELKRKGVTRLLLWQEYRLGHPDGCEYSAFCDHYRAWLSTQDAVLRQTHAPGDKLFVDYAGQTAQVVDPATGEIREAQVFVAVLGHSSYTYAEATWTQSAPDWIASHVRTFDFLDGSPAATVPDNLKAGVTKPDRYDPDLNPAYQEFSRHYGLAILPARVRKPRDKAAVESGVLLVERWILARLRNATFFSLAALNAAIRALVAELNAKPFQKREGTRASVFASSEKPALRPLPASPYEYATWKKAKVHLDYHVEVERRYYSVPFALIGRTVEVRLTVSTIEVFLRGQRVAAHLRSRIRGSFTTLPDHRPPRHKAVVELSHERLLREATAIGPATASVVRQQVHARVHPEQTLRRSLGILRLAKDFDAARLEAASERALILGSTNYRTLRALIKAPVQKEIPALSLPAHGNLRGPTYYQ